jgi:hypothetical protein
MRRYHLLAVSGFLASLAVVVAGGRVGPPAGASPLTSWFGLLSAETVRPASTWWPGALMTAGMACLVILWFVALRSPLTDLRSVWRLAACWAAPLAVGPPLLSSDVYTYAAQGIMTARGFDPYQVGPSVLGSANAANAVDPTWRGVASPYGPLATLIEHLAVEVGRGALGGVVVLRVLAVASVVAMGLLAVQLVEPARRPLVLGLVVINPLLLLQVVSAAHFEGLMGAAILASLVAVRYGHPRAALVLAFAAAAIKAPAFIVVLAVAVVAVVGLRLRDALRDLLVSGTVVAACAAVMSLALPPDAWGWVKALETPTQGHTPIAPASLLADLLGHIVPFAAPDDVSAAGRLATLGVAGCIVLALTLSANQRPLAATAGLGLLAVAILGPVLYPWYLLWGLVCLAPVVRGRQVRWFTAVCGLGAMTKLWGLTAPANVAVTAAVLVATAVVCLVPRVTLPSAARLRRTMPAPAPRPETLTAAPGARRAEAVTR